MHDTIAIGGQPLRQAGLSDAPNGATAQQAPGLSPTPRRMLGFEEVRQKLGVSARKARQIVGEAWFPDPIELGPRCLRWVDAEIDSALAARAPRRAEPGPEPAHMLRGRIERMKREGVPA